MPDVERHRKAFGELKDNTIKFSYTAGTFFVRSFSKSETFHALTKVNAIFHYPNRNTNQKGAQL